MKVTIDKALFNPKLRTNLFLFIAAVGLNIGLYTSRISEEFSLVDIFLLIALGIIILVSGTRLITFFRLIKKQGVVVEIENGELINYASMRIKSTRISSLESAFMRESHSGIKEIILRHKNGDSDFLYVGVISEEKLESVCDEINNRIDKISALTS